MELNLENAWKRAVSVTLLGMSPTKTRYALQLTAKRPAAGDPLSSSAALKPCSRANSTWAVLSAWMDRFATGPHAASACISESGVVLGGSSWMYTCITWDTVLSPVVQSALIV